MVHQAKEMKFLATPEKGEVSALLIHPRDASILLVLGHGASTNMRHATLQTIAERLADAGLATFRYNFPYMEYGRRRDSQEVCTATVRSAVAAAHKAAPDLSLLAGGHSFGGRMTTTAGSQSRCSSSAALATRWRTRTFYKPSVKNSVNARHSIPLTPPTTDSA